jgi:hypothetical protein
MNSEVTQELVKSEPRLEIVPNIRAGKDVEVARATNGRFVKKSAALAVENAKRVSKVMFTPDAEGKTKLERVITAQAEIAQNNTDPRNLNAVAGFLETVDELSGAKMARTKISKQDDPVNAIKIIMVSTPQLMNSELKEDHVAPEPPPFLRAEIVRTNPK